MAELKYWLWLTSRKGMDSVRALKLLERFVTPEQVYYADQGDIAGYADESLQTLYKLGVIQGVGGNRIDPLGQSTRAQAAAMLHRLLTVSQKAAE